MRLTAAHLLGVTAVSVSPVIAIVFPPDSQCSSQCGNLGQSTAPDDIECDQNSYGGDAGSLFAGCLDCELHSNLTSDKSGDVGAGLYNLRYAMSYCLWSEPHNENVLDTPCLIPYACGKFKDAIQYANLSATADNYEYCSLWPVADEIDLQGCQECLRAGDHDYLANFVTVLQAGCEQKPVDGIKLAISGEVFSTQTVNVSSPSPVASINPDWFDHGAINLRAKVGIAFAGFAFLLAIAGIFIVCNGKRRRRAYLRKLEAKYGNKGWPVSPQTGQGEMFETPTSQRPLRGWEDSPTSAHTQSTFPRYFSPYASQYNSPTSAQEVQMMQWPELAVQQQSVGLAVGNPDRQEDPAGHGSRGNEAYELNDVSSSSSGASQRQRYTQHQQQPPMLGHPGFGRKSNSPPRTADVQMI